MAKKKREQTQEPEPVHAGPRNRIKRHAVVRAGDLVPHEQNWRTHPEAQEQALRDLYGEVGFARSLLAYETADGSLKLIDGHLRRGIDPDMMVTVEVLDVTDEEAKKLLAVIDPLGAMAGADSQILSDLLAEVQTQSSAVSAMLAELAADAASQLPPTEEANDPVSEWQGMPAYDNPPTACQAIHCHFASREDVEAFAAAVGRDVPPETKTLWFPAREKNAPGDVWESSGGE